MNILIESKLGAVVGLMIYNIYVLEKKCKVVPVLAELLTLNSNLFPTQFANEHYNLVCLSRAIF